MTFNAKHEPAENPRAAGASGSWPPVSKRFPSTARQRGLATQAVQDRFSFEEVGADNYGPSTSKAEQALADVAENHAEKRCSKCHTVKPLTAFTYDKRNRDGRHSWCKACSNAHVKAYNAKNREKARASSRRAHAKRRDRDNQLHREWAARHPHAGAARQAVHRAARDGRLVKPDACEQCGWSGLRLNAHHDDYTRPLSVRWLCCSCHRLHHYAEAPRA